MNESQVFAAALKLVAPQEREAYLDRACGGDSDLRAQVEQLLATHAADPGFLELPVGSFGAPAAAPPEVGPPDPSGRADQQNVVIAGRYKLLQQIGEGGMGTVWMAEQLDPVRRLVAAKVIKPGMDSTQVIARFERERQALAMMDHPNIARVLDAGMAENGRPYFVMELVKGIPVTTYCDEHLLSPRERLELFVPVCQAIQHAHQKGIIHRDVKPSNVLVASYDGRAVPKVIDFGVAKATGQRLTEKTLFTGFGGLVGTLEYMSPEQAEFNALDIDTRSDVYSLGVLLYELLTGTTPLPRQRLADTPLPEALRLIREEEPPKPSTRLSESEEALMSVSARRKTEPARLAQLLRGDLDWIVLKALEKDRSRRYETADALARDLQRYLADEMVEARPRSTSYRLRKFVRRNQGALLAAGMLVGVLLAGMTGTTVGLIRAERARSREATQRGVAEAKEREADAQKKRAIEFRDKALEALRAMTDEDVKKLLDAKKRLGPNERAYLQAIAKRWQAFADQQGEDEDARELRGEGHYHVASIWDRLGRLDKARSGYEQARDILQSLNAQFPGVSRYQRGLAQAERALGCLLTQLGQRDRAKAALDHAIEIRNDLAAHEPEVPSDQDALAWTHTSLGGLYAQEGHWHRARAEHEQARKIWQKLAGQYPDEPAYRAGLAASQTNVAIAHSGLGNQDRACSEYEVARNEFERLVAQYPAEVSFQLELAQTYTHLGILLKDLGLREEAWNGFQRAREIWQRLATEYPAVPEYQIELGGSYCNLGSIVLDRRQAAESLEWFTNAIATLTPVREIEPRNEQANRYLRNSHYGRADSLFQLGRHADALKDWDKAIEFSTNSEQAALRAFRAESLVQVGRVAEAVGEVTELTKTGEWNAWQWHNIACVYAVASVKSDDRKEEFADRAVESLRNAVRAGWNDADYLAKNSWLDPLRERADFKQLVEELRKKTPLPSGKSQSLDVTTK